MPASLKICFVSAEFAPLAKAGGLADVLGALSRYLHAAGHDIRPFLPLYSFIGRKALDLSPVAKAQDVPLKLGKHEYRFSVLRGRNTHSTLPIYFVDCPALFDGAEIYGAGPDEHLRFVLLTRAAIETCQRMGFGPDIFHCHDWHTALAPLYLRSIYGWDRQFAATKTVLTIHNIGYQGIISAAAVGDLSLGAAVDLLHQQDLKAGQINFLKHGIVHADTVTTVSPTYAREILLPEYGMGLETVLQARSNDVVGILNGVDYGEWSPDADRYISHRYDARNLEPKGEIKHALLTMLKLKFSGRTPLIGIISRMARQKGFDLLFDTLPQLLTDSDVCLLAVGCGEAQYENFFISLQERFPGKIYFHRGYHEEFAHLIEAGSDIFLMPSLYEPCGLNQMYSLRYGTVPVVRKTGGLADSVKHFDPATGAGTGIVFNDFDSPAVMWALRTALQLYKDRTVWERLMRNGMREDFSWEKQGALYVDLYRSLIA